MTVHEVYTDLGVVHTDECKICSDLQPKILKPKRNVIGWIFVGIALGLLLTLIIWPKFSDYVVGGL